MKDTASKCRFVIHILFYKVLFKIASYVVLSHTLIRYQCLKLVIFCKVY